MLSWAMLEATAKVCVTFAEDMRERWRCCLEVMRGASVVLRTYASGLDLVRVSMPMACIAPADLLCLELHSAHDALSFRGGGGPKGDRYRACGSRAP